VIAVHDTTRVLAGRYVLERLLGRGGMAMVYAAADRRLGRQVAIKALPVAVTEPIGRARFVREARSAAGLCHPNAVAVFDAGEADGYLYIVMELVEGRTLADLLAQAGRLNPSDAAAIAGSVLAALEQAHMAGIVHRDVKPSNIMLSYDGTVKLLDFGIARRLDDLASDVTIEGAIVGTPTYLAPEQLEKRPTTAATDLYAVGVVVYEMLAGVAPFSGDTPAATALAHLNDAVPDVRSVRPDVPASLAVTIHKAMAKDPAQRYHSAAAMHAALSDSSADSTDVLRASTSESTQLLPPLDYRQRRRRPWWLAGVAAVAVGAFFAWNVATGLFSFITSGEPPEPRTALATPTSSAAIATTAPPTTIPSTIPGVIAALQANPDAYARQHTAAIVSELVKIEQGDTPSERAVALLDDVAAWADDAEVTPATLTLLEPVLTPLITTPVDATDDGDNGNGGNGRGGGNGHGRGGNDHGNGNGGGKGHGHNKNK
jgi:serine/threonine-protein kinase